MKCSSAILVLFLYLSSPFYESHAQVLPSDSLALVDLYNSTNGSSWTSHNNWLSGKVSTWEGISISGDRVQSIALRHHNLVGSLPSSICKLTQMQYLVLDSNGISGTLPSCMGRLSLLEGLYVSMNELTGAVPDSFAFAVPGLKEINISSNSISDVPDFSSLSNLVWLNVLYNKLTYEDIIPNLGMPGVDFQYEFQNRTTEPFVSYLDTELYGSITFPDMSVGGDGNLYSWVLYRVNLEQPRFINIHTPSMTNTHVELTDYGYYECVITNPAVPGMAILTGRFQLRIFDGLDELTIYELITPNGDGKNDYFYIKNAEYVVNEVSVFNSTNQVVYHQKNYTNDWDGGNLPEGEYYYVVNETTRVGETRVYKGKLFIKR